MREDVLLPDPVAVVGVHFEVEHRLVAAGRDLPDGREAAIHLHPLAGPELANGDPVAAVGAPHRVPLGHPQRLGLAGHPHPQRPPARVAERARYVSES